MKSFTDLEQSKVLKDILPRESADMSYKHFIPEIAPEGYGISLDAPEYDDDIPCWSLAALEEILDGASFTKCGTAPESYEATIFYNDEPHAALKRMTCTGTSYVDACYEMILKLHKNKLL